tara:strand:- start:293 stop:688 length:396 start_codon:yes stop_codon:yes gene_type:complete
MSNTIISKNMPTMSGGTADRDSTFILGRRAFLKQTYQTNNCDDSKSLANLYDNYKNIKTSNVYAKPLHNSSSDLRTQRLRLNAIGGGSLKVKDANSQTSFVKNGADINFVNNVVSRVRGGGSVAPKKGKKI